jgi:putative hemolysin
MEIAAGHLRARLVGADAAGSAFALRAARFRDGAPDRDAFDARAGHLLIEGAGGLLGCARVSVQGREDISRGYTSTFYDLTCFAARFGRALEVGRVCFAEGSADPDVPRIMLAALTRIVAREAVGVLYGCTSFPVDAAPLSRLVRAVAPADWAPARRALELRPLEGASGAVPPLMRAWLSLGAVVSDHAVVDRDLGTVHVFTALPVASIPPARARLLTGMLAPAD